MLQGRFIGPWKSQRVIRFTSEILLSASRLTVAMTCALFGPPKDTYALQTSPPPALEFTTTAPLALTPGKAKTLYLRNNTASAFPVTVKIVDPRPESSAPLSRVLTVTPDSIEISAAGVAVITVEAPAPLPSAEAFGETYIVAFGGGTFARKKLEAEASPPSDNGVKPPPPANVKEWTVRVSYNPFRWNRGGSDNNFIPADAPLPLKPQQTQAGLQAGDVLAYLTSKNGSAAALEYADSTESLPGGLTGLKLRVSPSPRDVPGKYVGNIGWQTPEDTKDDVAVTVYISHHYLLALLTLSAGIALAFFFRHRYLNVTRPVLILRERREKLEAAFAESAAGFAGMQADKPYAKYGIAEDFRKEVAELDRKIAALNRSGFSSADETAKKAIETRFEELETLVAAWGEFPQRLARLEAVRDTIPLGPVVPRPRSPSPFVTPEKPAVYDKATEILSGDEITLDEFKALNPAAKEMTDKASKWDDLNSYAARLSAAIHLPGQPDKLRQLVEEKQVELEEADKRLFSAWDKLWRNTDYANDEIARELVEMEGIFRELLRHEVNPPPVDEPALASSVVDTIKNLLYKRTPSSRRGAVEGAGGILRRINPFALLRRTLDWVGILLSVAIALYTGMKELYIDQSFGSAQDYVAAILWGFGVQTALTAVLSGLNMVWNSRLFSRRI